MQNSQAKTQLESRKQELTRRIEAIQKDLQKAHSADWAEQVTERENDEVLQGIAAESKASLQRINAALQRMEDGLYGICSSCEEPIGEKRLEAFPETDRCIRCAT